MGSAISATRSTVARCRRRNGELRTTSSPSAAALRRSSSAASVARARARTASAAVTSPGPAGVGGVVQQVGELVEHPGRLLPRAPQRGLRGDHRGRQGDGTADQGVQPAAETGRRGRQQGDHHHRLHRGLGDDEGAACQQHRRGHRQRDDHRDLPRAGADDPHEDVRHGDAHRHAEGDLADPARPLAVGRAEPDDRRDRREERSRMVEHLARDVPRDGGRDRDLADEERPLPQPQQPGLHVARAATGHPRAQLSRPSAGARPGRGRARQGRRAGPAGRAREAPQASRMPSCPGGCTGVRTGPSTGRRSGAELSTERPTVTCTGRPGRQADDVIEAGTGAEAVVRVRAKDALGAYGERVAAAHLRGGRHDGSGPQLALCPRGDRHRGARRRRAGGLRGQDPVVDGSRAPARGGHGPQGRPAAPAGGRPGSASGRCIPPTCASTWWGCCGRLAVPPGSSTSGGWPEWRWRAPAAWPWWGSTATWSRSRRTSGSACRRTAWSACRTRRWPSRATGSAPRWSTAASTGRRPSGSRSTCRRPACRSAAPASTCASRRRSSRPRRPCRRTSFDDAVLLGELGLDGRVRPVRGVLPPWWPPLPGPVSSPPSWSRPPTPPRRRWCRACGSPGCGTLAGLVARARGDDAARRRARRRTPAPAGRPAEDDPAHRAGPRRRARPGDRALPARGGRRRRPPPADDRAARCGQDDAGRAAARAAARRSTRAPRSR